MRQPKSKAALGLALITAAGMVAGITNSVHAKDIGPVHLVCDDATKGTAAWRQCIARQAAAHGSDVELFYAGYWLAKNAKYREALVYLRQVQKPDDRVLTYIGFATRKLGRTQEAFRYYQAALEKNPNAIVTRSYLGEAFLSIGALEKAKGELSEIANRCGRVCAPYEELAAAIAGYESMVRGHG